MDVVIGFAIFVIGMVLLWSLMWWAMRHFGGGPMTEEELAVPVAEGSHRPSVFGGGGVGYQIPNGGR